MIEKTDNIDKLNPYNKNSIFTVRILSLAQAYGFTYDFASFYTQRDDDGNITAVISRLDNDYTLCTFDNADKLELAQFFRTIGYTSVLSDENFNIDNNFVEGEIMVSDKRIERCIPYAQIDRYPKLTELFNFIDYDKIDFESWYVDISHRIRHNCAKAYALSVNDEIISSGIFSSIYCDDAILSAVLTLPKFRNMGYASTLISEMASDIKGKIYLMRESDKNEKFYLGLGFINNGKWRLHK